jgi:seryl-tRNA(Sec) selenium transferase
MKLSEFKEKVTQVLRERSINAISKLQQKNLDAISKALEFYKKNKHTDKKEPFIKLLKKLGKEKEALAKELDMKVSGMYKNAEYKGESVEESINEGPSTEEKRIAMLAVRKQAKYRNVSLEAAIQDQINALEELKRDAKRGKLK